jgi:hypothetical protein
MRMMFHVDGVARPASYIAQQLYLVFVRDHAKGLFDPTRLHIPEDKRELFFRKISFYCEAAVLRVLLTERATDGRYEELVQEWEKLIFLSQPSDQVAEKVEAIKAVMIELGELFTEEKPFSWCRRWWEDVGHDETNPALLALTSLPHW